MTYEEQQKINETKKLWKDIKTLYNCYLKPTKKQLKMQYIPCYPFLFKGRYND